MTFLRKIHQYQISWKSVQCEQSCSMQTGKTDRQDRLDETNSSISKFCESVYLRK